MNIPERTEYRFEDHHVDGDALVLTLDKDGDVLISTRESGGVVSAFYLRPGDVDALAVAVRRLGRTGQTRRYASQSVTAGAVPVQPTPVSDPRTPGEAESTEQTRVEPRTATFTETSLPAPGSETRERAYFRATEILGPSTSVESRVEMARYLAGHARWT